MSINTRTKALLLFGVIFAVCATLTIWLSGRSHITVIGGADGPTAIFMARSASDGRTHAEVQRAQLGLRLEEAIELMEGVENATVTLSTAENAQAGSPAFSSAAVHICLARGVSFSEEQLGAVTALVCGATGLPAEQVSLIATAAL